MKDVSPRVFSLSEALGAAAIAEEPKESDFEAAYRAMREWVGWTSAPEKSSPRGSKAINPKGRKDRFSITVINDVHVPFHDMEALREMIRRESASTDLLVVAGDLADMWSFSRWPKSSRLTDYKTEWQETIAVLRLLSDNFKEVVILPGNHEDRFLRFLLRLRDDPELMDFLEFAFPGIKNPLMVIARGLPNVTVAQPAQQDHARYNFLYQIGDLVIGHPEVYSIIPNRAVSNFIHYLQSKLLPAGVIGPFTVAGIGHTHQAGKTFTDFATVGFEMGCMCLTPEYDGQARIYGAKRPQVVGYTKFYQLDGKTDLAESNFIPLKFGRKLF